MNKGDVTNVSGNVSSSEVIIRAGIEEDIVQLLALNSKYLYENLSTEERRGGFIRIKFDHAQFLKIIEGREIVVAVVDSKIAGYYLVGRSSENNLLNYQYERAQELESAIGATVDRVGIGCQVCIDVEHRTVVNSKTLLTALTSLIKLKFGYLFGSVSKENISAQRAHAIAGWKLIGENEFSLFYLFDV